jgi:allantoinase
MRRLKFDILIRDADIVTAQERFRGSIGIRDGKIVSVGEHVEGAAGTVIEAGSLTALPGYIDAHVHLNEPGREDWEGFATGTAALAAGGCTAFADMPLNSTPVLDLGSFEAKAARLRKKSRLDGALWGGLVPGNLEKMTELASCGVIGFKAFMSNSGMPDFPRADAQALREGMARAAELTLPVAVHAESDRMTADLANKAQARKKFGIQDYLDSRPIEAELEAIGLALDLAKRAGCALHVVHVSSAAGIQLIANAKQAGQDVTSEVCPHYLLLDDRDALRLGAVAKCAPPLRSRQEVDKLWDTLMSQLPDTVGSDHSPSPPGLKSDPNFFKVWGGIAGAQHNYPLFLEAAILQQRLDPSLVARMTALNVATRFRLPNKGDLRPGWDADVVLVDFNSPHTISADDLLTRHQLSPYTGRPTTTRVRTTIAGGRIVYPPGPDLEGISARILRPSHP